MSLLEQMPVFPTARPDDAQTAPQMNTTVAHLTSYDRWAAIIELPRYNGPGAVLQPRDIEGEAMLCDLIVAARSVGGDTTIADSPELEAERAETTAAFEDAQTEAIVSQDE